MKVPFRGLPQGTSGGLVSDSGLLSETTTRSVPTHEYVSTPDPRTVVICGGAPASALLFRGGPSRPTVGSPPTSDPYVLRLWR